MLRHTKLFLREVSARYSPFLFSELCKQSLLLLFAYISICASTDDQKFVFGNVTDKGS